MQIKNNFSNITFAEKKSIFFRSNTVAFFDMKHMSDLASKVGGLRSQIFRFIHEYSIRLETLLIFEQLKLRVRTVLVFRSWAFFTWIPGIKWFSFRLQPSDVAFLAFQSR